MRISMNRELEIWKRTFRSSVRLAPSARILVVWYGLGDHARLYRPRGGKTTTLQMVAPGIAEALIATAIGCSPQFRR